MRLRQAHATAAPQLLALALVLAAAAAATVVGRLWRAGVV